MKPAGLRIVTIMLPQAIIYGEMSGSSIIFDIVDSQILKEIQCHPDSPALLHASKLQNAVGLFSCNPAASLNSWHSYPLGNTMTRTFEQNLKDFAGARLGIFIHYGLYSLLGRGEWALNREGIPVEEYRALANRFTAEHFNADEIVRRSKDAGAQYITFTTMHHDGFALYDSKINPFNSVRTNAKRDLVTEVVEACRKHGMRIHLYHSLNNWTCTPDSVAALESPQARKAFVDYTHARLRELVEMYNPIDCLWYDGWWPFNAKGWRAEEMNAMVRSIQPHLMVNGRNGLPGDFATPEGHMSAPYPWRPWEACMTHNQNWGFHVGDHDFKSNREVLRMVIKAATGAGNLLLNIGPDGSGRLPRPSIDMLTALAQWIPQHRDAIYDTEPLAFHLEHMREGDRGDWNHNAAYTARGNNLNLVLLNWPGQTFSITGLQNKVRHAYMLHDGSAVTFHQQGSRVTLTGLSDQPPFELGGVVTLECDGPPVLYRSGGLVDPKVSHPRYDPCPSDIQH